MTRLDRRTNAQLRDAIEKMEAAGATVPDVDVGPIVGIQRSDAVRIEAAAVTLEDAATTALAELDQFWTVQTRSGGPFVPHPGIEQYRAALADFVAAVRGPVSR